MRKTVLATAVATALMIGVSAPVYAQDKGQAEITELAGLMEVQAEYKPEYKDDGRLAKADKIKKALKKYGAKKLKKSGFKPMTIKASTWLNTKIFQKAKDWDSILYVVNTDGTYMYSDGKEWIGDILVTAQEAMVITKAEIKKAGKYGVNPETNIYKKPNLEKLKNLKVDASGKADWLNLFTSRFKIEGYSGDEANLASLVARNAKSIKPFEDDVYIIYQTYDNKIDNKGSLTVFDSDANVMIDTFSYETTEDTVNSIHTFFKNAKTISFKGNGTPTKEEVESMIDELS